MNKFVCILLFLTSSTSIFSQNVGINATGATPDASAVLDVSSTTKGMLTPRMTSAQRAAITTPAKGLLVFDNDTDTFWFYDGTQWIEFSNYWSKNGNDIYNNNTGNLGIGTPTPTSSLDVNGQVTIDQKNFGGYGGLLIKGDAPGNNYPNIAFSTLNNSGNDEIAAYIGGSITNNTTGNETMDLSFLTSTTGISGLSERMTIKGNGNIGINNNNPTTAKLVISGTSGQEGIDLSSSDLYANFRVIRNSLSGIDRNMYIGYGSGLSSSLKLYSNNNETARIENSNVYVDPASQNNGSSFFNLLSFGAPGSGEGIGSNRIAGTNQYGLDFYTSGSPKMSVINNGNVGIATINPLTKLAVNGEVSSTSANSFRSVFGNFGSFIRNDGAATYFLLTNSGDQYGSFNGLRPFSIDNTTGNSQLGFNAIYVQHGGNVGVGTTSPAVPLEVRRPTSGGANLRLSGLNETYMEFYPTNTTRYAWLGFSQPNIDKLWLYNERPGDLALVTGGNERLTLKNSGAIAVSGNTGSVEQVLTSNGSGAAPTWKSVKQITQNLTSAGSLTLPNNNLHEIPFTAITFNAPTSGQIIIYTRVRTHYVCANPFDHCLLPFRFDVYVDGVHINNTFSGPEVFQNVIAIAQNNVANTMGPYVYNVAAGSHTIQFYLALNAVALNPTIVLNNLVQYFPD